ncbi:MAG: hypothetical protein F6K39_43535 [Okeania sp. SIO3B3]|nr:hypothetical protein [Okeania sp. SIO3B3]
MEMREERSPFTHLCYFQQRDGEFGFGFDPQPPSNHAKLPVDIPAQLAPKYQAQHTTQVVTMNKRSLLPNQPCLRGGRS